MESLIRDESTVVPETPTAPRLLKHLGYVIESSGSWLRAEARGIAIVLTVTGRVDATNVDVVGGHLVRFVRLGGPLVVVMRAETEGRCGKALLDAFDDQCRHAGVTWILVECPDVHTARRTLADSIAAATRRIFDESTRDAARLAGAEDVATVAGLRAVSPVGQ